MNDPVVIVGAARTPIGALQGDFARLSASTFGAAAIAASVERAGVPAEDIEEVFFGCVLPLSAGATTVNKMCGSGMKAVMLAHDALRKGSAAIAVAGGMGSMTAPYLLDRARAGYRMATAVAVERL